MSALTCDPLEEASSLVLHAHSLDNQINNQHLTHYNNDLSVDEARKTTHNFSCPQISSFHFKALPLELQQRMKELQCACQMGVFEDVGRAWVSIDNEIYLWPFQHTDNNSDNNSDDVALYDGLNEVILTAALVKPKPNMFEGHVSDILVLATPLEVVLLPVSSHNNDFNIGSEALFRMSTDNIIINTVQGSRNGRIFMSGKDTSLYEIDYQSEYSWFGKRSIWRTDLSRNFSSLLLPNFLSSYLSSQDDIVQICVDESRHCLYTRTSHSNIHLFNLGKDGKSCSRVVCCNHQDNVNKIISILKTSEASKFGSIKDISCIPASQSQEHHLIAITQSGVRLFYTTTTDKSPDAPPSILLLVHVQLPSSFVNFPSSNKSNLLFEDMTCVLFSQGSCLMTSRSETEDRGDVLWMLSLDCIPLSSDISESYDARQLPGHVWQMRQLPCKDEASPFLSQHQTDQELACQHEQSLSVANEYSSNQHFVIVTSLGVCVVTKASLTDCLFHLLTSFSLQSQQLQQFFSTLQEQALNTCLSILISKNISHQKVSSEALKAYHLYKWSCSSYNTNYHTPMQPSAHPNLTSTSCSHRLLYTFSSRLLRPVWLKAIVTPVLHNDSKTTFLASRLKQEQIACVLLKVNSFKFLLQNNPSLLSPSSHPLNSPSSFHTHFPSVDKRTDSITEMDEAASLRHLSSLLENAAQLLSLWSLLCQHQFHVVSSKLSPDEQQSLVSSTFKQLIVENAHLSKSLVRGLIELHIEDHAAFDVVSARLQQNCPLFYTVLDQALNKGNEYMNAARTACTVTQKEELIVEALKNYRMLFSTPATSLTIDLSSICSKLSSASAYSGVLQLVMLAAASRDPSNLALHYYLNKKPLDDLLGEKHYRIRLDCYKSILECLNHLLFISKCATHEKSSGLADKFIGRMMPSIFSSSQQHKQSTTCKQEALSQMELVVKEMVESEDRMCVFVLFTWMLENNLTQELLQVNSAYVEEYLKHECEMHAEDMFMQKILMDLLARHYMQDNKYMQAGTILDSLALKHGNHMDLCERLQLMTRASLCFQSSSSPAGGHMLHEIHDKVEVMMLQSEVLKEVEKISGTSHAIHLLNSQLFDVSELYTLFATPYDLSKCKLSIIKCSGHFDTSLVESLWRQVLNKELTERAGKEVGERIEGFCSLVVSLASNHQHSHNYFPLDFIVKELEEINVCEDFCEMDVSCMSTALLKAGIDLVSLHRVYTNLYQLKSTFWRSHNKNLHVLEVDAELINMIIKQLLATPPSSSKLKLVGELLACTSSSLLELQAEVQQQPHLITSFKQMHSSLRSLQQQSAAFSPTF